MIQGCLTFLIVKLKADFNQFNVVTLRPLMALQKAAYLKGREVEKNAVFAQAVTNLEAALA